MHALNYDSLGEEAKPLHEIVRRDLEKDASFESEELTSGTSTGKLPPCTLPIIFERARRGSFGLIASNRMWSKSREDCFRELYHPYQTVRVSILGEPLEGLSKHSVESDLTIKERHAPDKLLVHVSCMTTCINYKASTSGA